MSVNITLSICIAVVIGALGGVAFGIFAPPNIQFRAEAAQRFGDYQYSGTVVEHNTSTRTLTISMHSTFPVTSTPEKKGLVRFVYDEDTKWSLQTFFFDAGILHKRSITNIQPMNLRTDVLVTIAQDPRSLTPHRAMHITVLSRETL